MRIDALGVTNDGRLVDPHGRLDGSLDVLTEAERDQVKHAVMLKIWRTSLTESERYDVQKAEEILERHGLQYHALKRPNDHTYTWCISLLFLFLALVALLIWKLL